MNCQDVAEILDNRSTARLTEAERSEIETHLDGCAQCARDWRLHGDFAALPDMDMPEGFAHRCRALVASSPQAGSGQRARSRFIVIGALAALAAAAAMLVWSTRERTVGPSMVTSTTEAPAVVATAEEAAPTPLEPVAAPPAPLAKDVAAVEPTPVAPRLTVYVRPLLNEGKDAVSTAAIAAFHASLLDQLRGVPGLELVLLGPGEEPSANPPVFTLTVRGGNGPDDSINVLVSAEGASAAGMSSSSGFSSGLTCEASAIPASLPCEDPSVPARKSVDMLRAIVFPLDPSWQQGIRSRLIDPALDPDSRLRAFNELATRAQVVPRGLQSSSMNPLYDDAMVLAVLDLVPAVNDPWQRASIWRSMRGVANPGLVQPLIDAAQADSAREVRVAAMATLGADYLGEPRARIALETAAREDSSPLLRALAQRALSGEGAWREYVAASLRDDTLLATERVAALLHHVVQPGGGMGRAMYPWGWFSDIFDDGTTRALVDVLPAALEKVPPRGMDQTTLNSLADMLFHGSQHPAVTGLLVRALQGQVTGVARSTAMRAAARRGTEPGIREALQGIAAGDADPALREEARRIVGAGQ